MADTEQKKFAIQRFSDGELVVSLAPMSLRETQGVTHLLHGVVPTDMQGAADVQVGHEWRFHLGGPEWIIVTRTA